MEKYSKKIGFIPDDWDFIDAKNCLILESGMRPKEYVTDIETDVPSLGGENIDEKGFLVFDNVRYINPNYYRKMTKGHIQDDDIYINKDGANTGKVAYCRKKPFQECAVNEHVFLIRNDGSFIQQFLFYCLLSDKGHKQILKKIIGSAQEGINNSFTKGIILPQPPLAEQTAIAKILSTVDEAIRSTRETISKLERVKKSLMQNLLSGKMKPDGTLRPATEFYEDDKMGLVPKGWTVKKVGEIAERKTDVIDPLKTKDVYDYIGLEHIAPNEFSRIGKGLSNETQALKVIFDKGDLLYGKLRPYLNKVWIADISGVGSTEFIVLKQNDYTYYLYLNMQMKRFLDFTQSMTAGTQHPRVSWRDIQNYSIIVPENNEMNAIQNVIMSIENKISNNKEKITALESLKKSLMQQLLTGRVRVK